MPNNSRSAAFSFQPAFLIYPLNTPPTSDKWFNITCKWDRPFCRLYRQFQCRHILYVGIYAIIWPNMVLSHEITGSRLYMTGASFVGMGSIMWIHMNPGSNVPAFSIPFTCTRCSWPNVSLFPAIIIYVDVCQKICKTICWRNNGIRGRRETAGTHKSIWFYLCSCIVFNVVVSLAILCGQRAPAVSAATTTMAFVALCCSHSHAR